MYACIRKPYLSSLLIRYLYENNFKFLAFFVHRSERISFSLFREIDALSLIITIYFFPPLPVISNRFEKFPSTFEHALTFLSTFPT